MYGQAIIVRMIGSREEDVERHMKILQQKFEERGYPSQMVSQYLQKGIQRERVDLLKPKPQYQHHMVPTPMTTKVPFKPTFIITYNPHNPPLKEWLIEGHSLLKSDQKLMKFYPKPPSVTFRQAPS